MAERANAPSKGFDLFDRGGLVLQK